MTKQYVPPVAALLCFTATEQIALDAPLDLLNGSKGLGTATTVSTTDIRINL